MMGPIRRRFLVAALIALPSLFQACDCGSGVSGQRPECQPACGEGQFCCPLDYECRTTPPLACTHDPGCMPWQHTAFMGDQSYDPMTCMPLTVDCTCENNPALEPGPAGRFSSLAIDPVGAVFVSAYMDEEQDDPMQRVVHGGDLVFGAASADGSSIAWKPVDGVPDGPVVADPSGWRGGVRAHGDDVGAFTSLAIGADGEPRIAYQDRTHGALKLARRAGMEWTTSIVDDGGGAETGRYASLALDASDTPLVAYFSPRLRNDDGTYRSELRAARAATATPTGPADFTVEVIESETIPCAGACAMGEVCVADGLRCLTPLDPSNCGMAGCMTGSCVDRGDGMGPVCADTLAPPTSQDLPEGVGLFASLELLPDGRPAVAYYDRTLGELHVRVRGADAWNGWTVEGGDTVDAGMHCDLAVGADGTLHVSYVEAVTDQLWYRQVNPDDGTSPGVEVIDDGVRPEGTHVVGADSAILVAPDGMVHVVYQDSTTADLLYARRSGGGTWTWAVVANDRGYGFYNDLARAGDGSLWTSTYYIDPRDPMGRGLKLFKLR